MAMIELQDERQNESAVAVGSVPVSVIIAARNEGRNLPRCLAALRDFGEVYVIDSQSTDGTAQIARDRGAHIIQFHYQGGWPKKRQWAMDTLPLVYEWILLLDADEIMTADLQQEICEAICDAAVNGYYICLEMRFMGRVLRHGDAGFWKMALIRRGRGHFECRLRDQNASMADMEVHEHVVVDGRTARLKQRLTHHNEEPLSRYIAKHNEYSNWESRVLLNGDGKDGELPAALLGTQAQQRRWFKKKLYRIPGSPVLLFLYRYIAQLGFLDGTPGLIYCAMQGIQMFHTKAKIWEMQRQPDKC